MKKISTNQKQHLKFLMFLIFLLFLIFLIAAGGCSIRNEDTSPVRIGIPDDVVSFDPASTKDVISEALARSLFSTLYTFDEDMNLVYLLAEKSSRLSDTQWEFTLKENITFHDNTPLRAEDFCFSIERAKKAEDSDNSIMIIESAVAKDDRTILITTTIPCVTLPYILARISTSVMSKSAMEKPDYDSSKPIGSGPFMLLSHEEGRAIHLERYPKYFNGAAKSKYLDFIIDGSEQNRTASLLNNTLDVIFRISSYDCDYLKLNDNVKVYQKPSTKMELMLLNPSYEPLQDVRIREAIIRAINRQNLIDNVLDGYGSALNGLLPPPIAGSISTDYYTYDPKRSKQLLTEAGYPDGLDVTILAYDAGRKKLMEYIKLDLAQVNIRVDYELLDLSDYLSTIREDAHQISSMSWTSNADPDSTFAQLFSKSGSATVNQCHYSDEAVEELMELAKQEPDPQKQAALYQEANETVSKSYFYLPLYQPDVLVAADSSIEGVTVNAQGLFQFENLYRNKKK